MASEGLEYNDVALLVRGALNAGRLKLQRNGAVFKASKTGVVDHINKDDIESAHWLKVARGQELKVVLKSGAQFRFEGFKESDYSNLSEFLSQFYKVKVQDVELSVKGWNWGTAEFKGYSMSFEVDKKPAFEIPLKDVSQVTTAGDNEVTLEFHQHDDAEVSLMEMRFYIPTGADSTDPQPVKTFHEHVASKADIIQITGDAIVTIPDIACLTPRGRYTVKVFPAFMQLHGKTYDYKIPYTTILRLFLLPHKDQRFMFFVVSMDPPIKQGQTRYPFLITQFEKQEEFDVKLNMSEEEIQEKFEGKITQDMSGPIYEIVSKIMKAVVGKKITVPGTFKSHTGANCMTCSFRAGSGLLYPLERGFIFVHKPPIHVRFDEISCVNFARVSGGGGSASRSFDFEVETKSGSKFVFSSIEREEYSRLFDFVNAKKLRIKNTGKLKNTKENKYDEHLFDSDDDQTHDAYLEQVKAEAADRESDDSEESDSDDESFAPDEDSDKDIKEEYDSEPSSSDEEGSGSGSEDDEKSKKKKAKKEKEKKRKAEKQKSPKKKKTPKKESGETTKKGKKKKDPNAPKRAMSAYMLWLADVRQEIKDQNPGIAVTQLTKLAGERWKNLTDKSKWEKQAALEKEKYEQKMKEYKKGLASAGPSSSPSTSKTKDKKESKKIDTKSSPRKSVDGQKFKSAEFVESSDGSSDSDDDTKKKKKSKPTKEKKKKEESDEEESMEENASEEEEEEEMSDAGSDSD